MEQPSRTLEDICTLNPEGLQLYIKNHNVPYCGLNPTSPDVECKYRDKEPSPSGMYICNEPFANMLAELDYDESGKQNK